MSAVASFSWVASLPCALSMRYSDEVYPAAVKACFRYGASKSTHRVDDVVSGRTTPTCRLLAPLVPAAASALNRDIVGAMLTVKELMPTDGTVAEPVADAEAEELERGRRGRRRRTARSRQGKGRCQSHPAHSREAPERAVALRTGVPTSLTSVTHSHSPYPFAWMYPNKPTGTPVEQRCPFGGKLVHSTLEIQGRKFSRQQNVRPRAAIRPVMMSNCGRLTPGTCSPDKPGATSSPDALPRDRTSTSSLYPDTAADGRPLGSLRTTSRSNERPHDRIQTCQMSPHAWYERSPAP